MLDSSTNLTGIARVGWKLTLGLMPYGDRLRQTRKLLHEGMSNKAMEVCERSISNFPGSPMRVE